MGRSRRPSHAEPAARPSPSGPPPTQAALDRIIQRATRVRVWDVNDERMLLTVEDEGDLEALRSALRVREDVPMGYCMCLGDVAFHFSHEGGVLGKVTLHHGISLRWEPCWEDAALADPEPVLDWLTAHGAPGVREAYEAMRRPSEAAVRTAAAWRAAMPAVLEPAWESMTGLGEPEWSELEDALTAEYPEPVERARVLLVWFGHGVKGWTGHPSYEYVPAELLRRTPLDVLVAAARSEPQDAKLLEGAARLFAGWEPWHERNADLARIPRDLGRTLLTHALADPDEEKHQLARAAFGP